MRRLILLAIAAVYTLGGQVYAQWSVHKPARSEQQTLRVAEQLRSASPTSGQYRLPRLERTTAELRALSRERESVFRTLTYAQTRVLPREVMHSGQWLISQEGSYVWRLSITSPEALGVAVLLEQYQLPAGASLYAYGSGGGRIGALTEQHNSPRGILQLAPLSGETITLEYELPEGQVPQQGELPPFVVSHLDHDYVGVRTLRSDRGVARQGEPFFNAILRLESMNCAPNVVAIPECKTVARSVVVLAIGGSMSSGALINTPRSDGKAYILTAAHNVNQLYDISDLNTIKGMVRTAVIFFGFESPSLEGNIRATEEMSLSGAELVAYDPQADMAVLEITGLPTSPDGHRAIPKHYNAYFSGWSISPTPPAPYFGVHHPGIMTKRYSQVEDTSLSVVDFAAVSRGVYWEMKHWHVKRWAIGSTAAGSSGSPLFDRDGRIIGALTAGYSYCPNTRAGRLPEDDYYYAIHRAWQGSASSAGIPTSLGSILDPDSTGTTECPGYDPHESEALYRLSDLYAADRGVELSTIAPEDEGVGRLIAIDGSARPLGVYLVFKGNETIDESFPSLLLELRPYDRQTNRLAEVVWQEEVQSARYRLYRPFVDQAGNKHYDHRATLEQEQRSLSRDTIELFVPIYEQPERSLPQGEYLLSVRSKAGGGLGLPLLQHSLPQKPFDVISTKSNIWYYTNNTWQEGGAQRQAQLWLDLLVGSTSPQTTKAEPHPQPTMDKVEAYYSLGQLHLSLPQGAEGGQARIFSEDGKLMARLYLSEGISSHPIYLPATAVYVAQVKCSKGERTLKFIVR